MLTKSAAPKAPRWNWPGRMLTPKLMLEKAFGTSTMLIRLFKYFSSPLSNKPKEPHCHDATKRDQPKKCWPLTNRILNKSNTTKESKLITSSLWTKDVPVYIDHIQNDTPGVYWPHTKIFTPKASLIAAKKSLGKYRPGKMLSHPHLKRLKSH